MINTNMLKGKLKEKNFTQEEIAQLLGVNPATLNKKINNSIGENFTIEEATKLASILELNIEELTRIFFA